MNPVPHDKPPERLNNWRPYALLCWAGNVVVARGIVDTFSPVSMAFWRWSLAFLILLPFASFLAVIWLQESLKVFHFAGLLLVFMGMVLFNK